MDRGSADALPIALTLDRYGHLMPGQARSVADRLDEMARRARPIADAPVTPLRLAAEGGAGVASISPSS